MPAVTTQSNHFKYQKSKKQIDLATDTIIAILMNTTFTFNQDNHATLADVTADQLATGNGYTQDNKTLINQVLTEDDANNRAVMTADNVTFAAAGGNIGPTGAVCLIDTSTADDTLICCTDFGEDHTIQDGTGLQLQNIVIEDT